MRPMSPRSRRHPTFHRLAGALLVSLGCASAPAPVFALRAVGLEENRAKEDVEIALHSPLIVAPSGSASTVAAGAEEPARFDPRVVRELEQALLDHHDVSLALRIFQRQPSLLQAQYVAALAQRLETWLRNQPDNTQDQSVEDDIEALIRRAASMSESEGERIDAEGAVWEFFGKLSKPDAAVSEVVARAARQMLESHNLTPEVIALLRSQPDGAAIQARVRELQWQEWETILTTAERLRTDETHRVRVTRALGEGSLEYLSEELGASPATLFVPVRFIAAIYGELLHGSQETADRLLDLLVASANPGEPLAPGKFGSVWFRRHAARADTLLGGLLRVRRDGFPQTELLDRVTGGHDEVAGVLQDRIERYAEWIPGLSRELFARRAEAILVEELFLSFMIALDNRFSVPMEAVGNIRVEAQGLQETALPQLVETFLTQRLPAQAVPEYQETLLALLRRDAKLRSAAGMEERVMIPPGSGNPFVASETTEGRPPDFVINTLTVYYTAKEPKATEQIGAQIASALAEAPPRLAQAAMGIKLRPLPPDAEPEAYTVLVVAPKTLSDGEQQAYRDRHVAVIEWSGPMTAAQLIQQILVEWTRRSEAEVGEVIRVEYHHTGRLGIWS